MKRKTDRQRVLAKYPLAREYVCSNWSSYIGIGMRTSIGRTWADAAKRLKGKKMTDQTKLLPCPFCGGLPRMCDRAIGDYPFWVVCGPCDSAGPRADTRAGAADRWNRRAPVEAERIRGIKYREFPVGLLGHPMREFAPGQWESAKWPSDAAPPPASAVGSPLGETPRRAYWQTHEPPHCPTCDCAAAREANRENE